MSAYSWLVRREFWENRAIWMVPLAIGAALTLGALFGKVDLATAPLSNRFMGGFVLFAFGLVFFAVMSIYSSWYLLDCLHADRRDRSVLFWKSLPVSDSATVLTKLFTALIAIPCVYFVVADLTTLLVAFIVSVRARSTVSAALWQADLWVQLQAAWVYVIVTSAIWYLPIAGWLLAVSAWARRAVMLWSVMPLLAAYLLERWFFGTHVIGTAILARLLDYPARAFRTLANHSGWVTTTVDDDKLTTPQSVWSLFDPLGFFTAPATWTGAVLGAVLVIAAIQMRLRRTEM